MAFEETLRDIKEMRANLSADEDALRGATRLVNRLDSEITDARIRLRNKQEDNDYPSNLAAKIAREMRVDGTASSILISEIDAAIIGTEFERSMYRTALYEAAQDADIYNVTVVGAGWGARLSCFISFSEAAGDLNDWAAGIEGFRDSLKTKIEDGSDRGFRATNWWQSNVHGGSLEVITFYGRMEFASGVAPFWQILNNGSQPLASDRPDGSYNPIPQEPTNFIGNAEQRINSYFLSLFTPERLRWEEEIRLLRNDIDMAVGIRDEFENLIQELEGDIRRDQEVRRRLEELERRAEDVSPSESSRRYRAGDEYDRPLPEDGTPGLYERASQRVSTAVRAVQGFFKGIFRK